MEAEDNMNSHFVDVQYTDRTGKTSHLESVYIRGSKIRFLVLPDMLKHAPMFKNMKKSYCSIVLFQDNLLTYILLNLLYKNALPVTIDNCKILIYFIIVINLLY